MKHNFYFVFLSFLICGILNAQPLALSFDGVDDCVNLGDNLDFEVTDQFSVEAWIKTSSTVDWQQIISKLDIPFVGWGFQLQFGQISGYISSEWDSNFALFTGSTAVNDGKWHHVAMTYNGDAYFALYVDGKLESYSEILNTLSSGSSINDAPLHIGCLGGDGDPVELWTGNIEDLRIWDTVLTQATIQENMHKCFDGSEENLLAYYNFNNPPEDLTVQDLSPNGYDGTTQNMDINAWVEGLDNSGAIGIDTIVECNSYTWIDGINYTENNDSALYTIANGSATGCDSTVLLFLTINKANVEVSQNENTITSAANATSYQWLDCDDDNSQISGANNQSFTPTENGNFAVEIIENGCIDTSECITVTSVGINKNVFIGSLNIYPNPTQGNVSIEFEKVYSNISTKVIDITGKVIYNSDYNNTRKIDLLIEGNSGIYFIELSDSNGTKEFFKLIKE